MADEDQDDSQKTEDPSQKRLDDALKKGQVVNSREVTSFVILLSLALTLSWMAPSMMTKTTHDLMPFIESPHLYRIDSGSILPLMTKLLGNTFVVLLPPLAILIFMIITSSLVQHPIVFSADAFAPKLERISPMKGLGRIFSAKTFVELIKGIFKIIVVGIIAYKAILPYLSSLNNVIDQSIFAIMLLLMKMVTKMMIGICVFMGGLAALDFLYQSYEHNKSLRMSKRDLKDEYKQTEGSPEIKAKLREIRNKRAQGRMMAAVPDADVVITNPTHYSIALKYEQEKTEAPVVVAKGMDFIALKIREVAKENNVPIVENAPLARALYNSVEIEQQIPLEHYQAVAEVIRYVYKLKGKL